LPIRALFGEAGGSKTSDDASDLDATAGVSGYEASEEAGRYGDLSLARTSALARREASSTATWDELPAGAFAALAVVAGDDSPTSFPSTITGDLRLPLEDKLQLTCSGNNVLRNNI
jgi:hypothetical protein